MSQFDFLEYIGQPALAINPLFDIIGINDHAKIRFKEITEFDFREGENLREITRGSEFQFIIDQLGESIIQLEDPNKSFVYERFTIKKDISMQFSIKKNIFKDSIFYIIAGINITEQVRCWGNGSNGQLGYDNANNVGDGEPLSGTMPPNDVNVGGTVTQITSGSNFICALLEEGNVRCWGNGLNGRLGYGNINPVGDGVGLSIIDAGNVAVGGTVTQISAGRGHTCALLEGGNVRCWGISDYGQLGYGNAFNVGDGLGVSIIDAGNVNIGGTVIQIAAGGFHSCALLEEGNVRCWGRNDYGQLGYGNVDSIGNGIGLSIIAAGDVNVGGAVIKLESGESHTCALLEGGNMRCWGRGEYGQLGYGNVNNVGNGVGLSINGTGNVNTGGVVTQITAGNLHTCALLETGTVRCWGYGVNGQLGYNNANNVGYSAATSIVNSGDVDVGGRVIHISNGANHTCAVLESRSVRCWGAGGSGRLGYGNINPVGNGSLSIVNAGDVPFRDTE